MVNITAQDTVRLISKMRALYGRKFDQQWAGVDPQMLAETFADGLQGLTEQELRNGIQRMMREPWPPTIPEFRQWCEQGGSWFTADEAWAMSLAYLADPDQEITTQAKTALTKIRYIIDNEGQKAAARAFKDFYVRVVEEAKTQGVAQSIYKPKVLPKPQPAPEPTAEEAAEQKAKAQHYAAKLKKMLEGAA
ncbi:MAG: hypothetical protein VXW65_04385 [Pseudomonadota bacterium]|nr:hypothetical protein [Pseudomonadota bacterium]